jgi:hypothetical protein
MWDPRDRGELRLAADRPSVDADEALLAAFGIAPGADLDRIVLAALEPGGDRPWTAALAVEVGEPRAA